MRTLAAALTAAQKAASGLPFVRTVAVNAIRGLRHYVFAQTFSDGAPDDLHGAVGDNTYLHRARVRVGVVQYERDAGTGWTALTGVGNSQVAIAAVNNARVIVVYVRGTNIYFRESTDQGTSFGTETLIISPGATPLAVAVAYKNTSGDLAVFYEESNNVKRIRRTSGTFGSAATWTQTAASLNGLAVTYNLDFLLAVTGTETTTLRPTLWSLALGDGGAYTLDTWTAFFIQQQAETDESVTFHAPSIVNLDTVRVTFVEKFTGTPAYTRTFWTLVPLTTIFSVGPWEWQDPAPLDNTTAQGYAITKRGTSPLTLVLSRPAQVLEAPGAAVSLDMSADLVDATIEEVDGLTQRGHFVFDNSNGQYAGPPAPIALHRDLDIGLGYDAAFSRPPLQSIVGWCHERRGGRSVFVLLTRGLDYWLGISRPRTTIIDTRKMRDIARGAAARAGLEFLTSAPSSRATTLDLEWTVHPDQSNLEVLRGLVALFPDVLYTTPGNQVTIHEPLAGDAIDYTYGTDHAIYELHAHDEPAPAFAEIFATGALGQAFDFARISSHRAVMDRRRDPHDPTGADANNAASARLRKAALATDKGELVTPPNVGLEVNDVVAYTEPHVHASQQKARVRSITTKFQRRGARRAAVYEQRVGLGGL